MSINFSIPTGIVHNNMQYSKQKLGEAEEHESIKGSREKRREGGKK